MNRHLVVAAVSAILVCLYGCSREEESKTGLQQTFETPKRVEQEVLRHLEEGVQRNRRALEAYENN